MIASSNMFDDKIEEYVTNPESYGEPKRNSRFTTKTVMKMKFCKGNLY